MNAAHTLGPWHLADIHGAARQHSVCAGMEVIARVGGLGYPIGKGWHPRSAADARLIAAAPDLLVALEALLDATESFMKEADWGRSVLSADTIRKANETPGMARAAIASALRPVVEVTP